VVCPAIISITIASNHHSNRRIILGPC
jgi:hypothetical protein